MRFLTKKELAVWGENTAKEHLLKNDIRILSSNYRTRAGEVDLIGQDRDDTLIFFEVKTRQSNRFGHPEEAVDDIKLERITNAAWQYICEQYEIEPLWRIDVVAIFRNPKDGRYEIRWIKNVIE